MPFADASIGLAYTPNPAAGSAYLDAWLQEQANSVSTLSQIELSRTTIEEFATMRRATSAVLSNFQSMREPTNKYLQCSADLMWAALENADIAMVLNGAILVEREGTELLVARFGGEFGVCVNELGDLRLNELCGGGMSTRPSCGIMSASC